MNERIHKAQEIEDRRWKVWPSFGTHWTVALNGKAIDHYQSRELAQAYVDYMNRRDGR